MFKVAIAWTLFLISARNASAQTPWLINDYKAGWCISAAALSVASGPAVVIISTYIYIAPAVTVVIPPTFTTTTVQNIATSLTSFGVAFATLSLSSDGINPHEVWFNGNANCNISGGATQISLLCDGQFCPNTDSSHGLQSQCGSVTVINRANMSFRATYLFPAGLHSYALTAAQSANVSNICVSGAYKSGCEFGAKVMR